MKTIKTTLYTFFMLCFITFTAQSQEKGVTIEFENYNSNMEILSGYVDAIVASDAKEVSSYLSDNALIIGLGGSTDTISKKEHLQRYTEDFKKVSYQVENPVYLSVKTDENAVVGAGEFAFAWGKVTGTIKENKKKAETGYHLVAAIVDGKIAALYHYYDSVPFLIRNGYTITPPKE